MSVTPFIQDSTALTNTAAAQGAAVAANTKRVMKAALLVNPTASPIAATVYLVPSGASAGALYAAISARMIAANESYPCPELIGQGLNAGGTVQALGGGLTFKYTAIDFV